jgi:hypothetical protein
MEIFRYKMEEGNNFIMRNFIICTLHKYHYDDQIKAGDVGGACMQSFHQKTWSGESTWEDVGIDRIILKEMGVKMGFRTGTTGGLL